MENSAQVATANLSVRYLRSPGDSNLLHFIPLINFNFFYFLLFKFFSLAGGVTSSGLSSAEYWGSKVLVNFHYMCSAGYTPRINVTDVNRISSEITLVALILVIGLWRKTDLCICKIVFITLYTILNSFLNTPLSSIFQWVELHCRTLTKFTSSQLL